jgi:hypothetical protein
MGGKVANTNAEAETGDFVKSGDTNDTNISENQDKADTVEAIDKIWGLRATPYKHWAKLHRQQICGIGEIVSRRIPPSPPFLFLPIVSLRFLL